MSAVTLEPVHLVEVPDGAVDAGPDVALGTYLLQQFAVVSLPPPHDRAQQGHPRALGQVRHGVDDLFYRLVLYLHAAVRAVGCTDTREEQTQEVVQFRRCCHRRARSAAGRLLFDGDGGRHALYLVAVRAGHLLQELPRVAGQALDVAALAGGIECVEGE